MGRLSSRLPPWQGLGGGQKWPCLGIFGQSPFRTHLGEGSLVRPGHRKRPGRDLGRPRVASLDGAGRKALIALALVPLTGISSSCRSNEICITGASCARPPTLLCWPPTSSKVGRSSDGDLWGVRKAGAPPRPSCKLPPATQLSWAAFKPFCPQTGALQWAFTKDWQMRRSLGGPTCTPTHFLPRENSLRKRREHLCLFLAILLGRKGVLQINIRHCSQSASWRMYLVKGIFLKQQSQIPFAYICQSQ